MSETSKDIAILYHGGCPDGFGGAYAAWKKFGNSAEYIPLKHGRPVPEGLTGKKLYFVDFCYSKEIMNDLMQRAQSVVVLDHHAGNKDVVESIPEHVFDTARSGATIAWNYFHPDTPTPLMLQYVQDGDLYVFTLPDSRALISYMYAQPFHFEAWDALAAQIEDEHTRADCIARGEVYAEHFAILVKQMANKACTVSFEGHECLMVGASGLFASDIGNLLCTEKPPIGIVVSLHGDILTVSLRSNASVDVAAIAAKYGGGGHPRASGFNLSWGDPLPWTVLKEHEDPRH